MLSYFTSTVNRLISIAIVAYRYILILHNKRLVNTDGERSVLGYKILSTVILYSLVLTMLCVVNIQRYFYFLGRYMYLTCLVETEQYKHKHPKIPKVIHIS